MSPTVVTFLYEAANFLVLAAVLSWLFFKPVRQALADHRAKFEADNLQAAQKLAEAEEMLQEASAARAGLGTELEEQRRSENEATRRHAERIIDDARAAADRQLEQSRRQAARISDMQRDRLAEVSATVAAQAVGRLLEQIGGRDLHTALVDSACRQFVSLPQGSLGTVKIESTQPLSAEQRTMLNSALGPAADQADFRKVGGLGDGVRIMTSKGMIDATVSGLVQFASQSLAKEMGRLANNHLRLQNVNDV